jgi:hypothetical protein
MTNNDRLVCIGDKFPSRWLWGHYEQVCIDSIQEQIQKQFSSAKNLLINLTWFGPQFSDHQGWKDYQQLLKNNLTFDNLFLLTTVDPPMINPDQIQTMVNELGNPQLFKLGNFDTDYHFNFFAPMLKQHFRPYTDQDLKLKSVKWLFINYNRKPRQHRVDFVKKLIQQDLKKYGLVTLGKPNVIYDNDPNNNLFFTLNEKEEDYIPFGHWGNDQQDPFGLPHDVLSLHNLHYWQNHFLYIIGATEFNHWDDIFVSETQFKPMLGLRPFLINGNTRTYHWLEQNGFRHFNKYWPNIDFTDHDTVHDALCEAITYLTTLSEEQIKQLYHDMMPDLQYNQHRFLEFANEQQHKIHNLFE